jgi:hypothetical protein
MDNAENSGKKKLLHVQMGGAAERVTVVNIPDTLQRANAY